MCLREKAAAVSIKCLQQEAASKAIPLANCQGHTGLIEGSLSADQLLHGPWKQLTDSFNTMPFIQEERGGGGAGRGKVVADGLAHLQAWAHCYHRRFLPCPVLFQMQYFPGAFWRAIQKPQVSICEREPWAFSLSSEQGSTTLPKEFKASRISDMLLAA